MNILKKVFVVFGAILVSSLAAFSVENHTITNEFVIPVPEYMNITPITSPVLTANITNRTGNLYAPLSTTFRVATNTTQTKTLYLQANVTTQGGYESSMFEQGGQIYVAFANIMKMPTSTALSNCKMGSLPEDSPGVVAYPVTSVTGAENKFLNSRGKYEVYVDNGITSVTINIGSNVLQNSFGKNDPRGFYQAVLSLTEADI